MEINKSFKDKKLKNLTMFKDYQKSNFTNLFKVYNGCLKRHMVPAFYLNQLILSASIQKNNLIELLSSNYGDELLKQSLLKNEMED